MNEIPAPLRYAAFTDDPAGGNPAGVVIADASATSRPCGGSLREVGYSETAFVASRRRRTPRRPLRQPRA